MDARIFESIELINSIALQNAVDSGDYIFHTQKQNQNRLKINENIETSENYCFRY